MNIRNSFKTIAPIALAMLTFASCSDDNNESSKLPEVEENYVGAAVGNFSAEEWYVGGELGTTMNVTAGCYEDETPAVTEMGLSEAFNRGEQFFERNVTEFQAPFNGLGPAYVRKSCLDCHPGYGHGKRVTQYTAEWGNGYLLVVYHPADGDNRDDGPYIAEVTGMPQTRATYPFLPPIDEKGIHLSWPTLTAMGEGSEISATHFPDGETYSLIYPELSIDVDAFNTDPKPENLAFRLESTIGIIGSGLLDAIPDDSLKKQYQREAPYTELNPAIWDKANNTWADGAMYKTIQSGKEPVNRIKKFTYACTRGSLQDGAGANAIWNITNVSRSDRPFLYTTAAWANAMSKNPDVIAKIKQDPTSPYYADGTDEGIAAAVKGLLSPSTNQFDNEWHNFTPEMTDNNFWSFMVWHRGLAIPRARNLQDKDVQRGKELFYQIGCTACHRPSWNTGNDDYWAPALITSKNLNLPRYKNQTIWPYTDMVQHRLYMKNGIHGSWCRTTPLWGRGLSQVNTGAEDRLHDCRARNEIEAILWHGYSSKSDAYDSTLKFYKLPKSDRDAIVKFLRSI
ncbi:MAG: hypothetical protein IJ624_04870 [Prevotella sp.]|nr:hypothetical protein [Prevotella sp.]